MQQYVQDVMTIPISSQEKEVESGAANVYQQRIRQPIEIVDVSFHCNSDGMPMACWTIIDLLKNGRSIFSQQPVIERGKSDSKESEIQPTLVCCPTVFDVSDVLQIDLVQAWGGRGYLVDIQYRKSIQYVSVLPTISHNEDFSCVNWNGESFTFNEPQAIVVATLWKAWERGTVWVSRTTLLDEIASSRSVDSERIRDIFKSGGKVHKAWNKMIVPESNPNRKQLFGLTSPKSK